VDPQAQEVQTVQEARKEAQDLQARKVTVEKRETVAIKVYQDQRGQQDPQAQEVQTVQEARKAQQDRIS
jgi:hypothetical protein